MVHVTISQYSSLLCPMVSKKIIHKNISELQVKIGLTKHIKFINTRLSITILEMKLHMQLQSSVKSFGKRKKKHILSKKYCEVISGQILTNFTPKHSELSIFCLFICSLCLYERFLFVHHFSIIVNFQDLFLVEIHRKIKFYLLCLNYVQIKITHNNIMSK